MLIGFVFAYFIMVPSVVPATGPAPQATLLTLVQVQRMLLLVGLAASLWLARGTAWRTTFVRLAIGAAAGFFLRLVTSGAISSGAYHEGSVYDLAWIVPVHLLPVGGHRSAGVLRRTPSRCRRAADGRRPRFRRRPCS